MLEDKLAQEVGCTRWQVYTSCWIFRDCTMVKRSKFNIDAVEEAVEKKAWSKKYRR